MIKVDRSRGRVALANLRAALELVAAELPGVEADDVTAAEELVQALLGNNRGALPQFVEPAALVLWVRRLALAQVGLQVMHDRPNVALLACEAGR